MARKLGLSDDSSPIVVGDSGSNPIRSLKGSANASYITLQHTNFHETLLGPAIQNANHTADVVKTDVDNVQLTAPWTLFLNGGVMGGGFELRTLDNQLIQTVGLFEYDSAAEMDTDQNPPAPVTKLRIGTSDIASAILDIFGGATTNLTPGTKGVKISWKSASRGRAG